LRTNISPISALERKASLHRQEKNSSLLDLLERGNIAPEDALFELSAHLQDKEATKDD
jgi:hypothetical protein